MFLEVDKKNESFVLPFLCLFSFMAIFFGTYLFLAYDALSLSMILLAHMLFAWLYYPIKKYTNYTVAANWIIFTLFSSQILQSLLTGSLQSTAFWWLVFTPILAAILLDQLHIVIWTLINLLGLIVLFLPHVGLIKYIDLFEKTYINLGINFVMISSALGLILVILQERYIRTQKKKEELKFESFIQTNFNSLSEMSASVAHEINNPLFVIKGNCDVLRNIIEKYSVNNEIDSAIQEDLETYLKKIENATKRATRTTRSLSQLTRGINFDKTEIFKISDVLKLIYEINKKKFLLKNIEFSIPSDQEMKDINLNCPKGQIIQVFLNLLNNSYDEVGEQLSSWIKIQVFKYHSFVEIHFIDSGKGISLEKSQDIFQPLFTTKEVGIAKGLGLSLSKAIMKKNFGDIYIDHTNKNTAFVVKLPTVNI